MRIHVATFYRIELRDRDTGKESIRLVDQVAEFPYSDVLAVHPEVWELPIVDGWIVYPVFVEFWNSAMSWYE